MNRGTKPNILESPNPENTGAHRSWNGGPLGLPTPCSPQKNALKGQGTLNSESQNAVQSFAFSRMFLKIQNAITLSHT